MHRKIVEKREIVKLLTCYCRLLMKDLKNRPQAGEFNLPGERHHFQRRILLEKFLSLYENKQVKPVTNLLMCQSERLLEVFVNCLFGCPLLLQSFSFHLRLPFAFPFLQLANFRFATFPVTSKRKRFVIIIVIMWSNVYVCVN